MEVSIQNLLFSLLYGAAAIQSLLLGIILWWRPSRQVLPNKILANLNFVFTILLLNNCYHLLGLQSQAPFFLWWPNIFWLLVPPVTYLYARTRLSNQPKLFSWDLIHLIPFLAVWFLWKDIIFISGAQKLSLLEATDSVVKTSNYRHIITILFPTLGFVYLLPSIFLISRFRKKNRSKWTPSAQNQFLLLQLIYSFLLVFIVFAELIYLFPGMAEWWPRWLRLLVGLVIPGIVYCLSYMALYDPKGFFEKIKLKGPLFQSRQLPDKLSKQYADQLEGLMKEEEVYTDPDLSQNKLAEHLGLQPRQLSRLLKQQFNCTFHDYINKYRIQKVKALMKDEKFKHWNLVAIAYEAGFNSKSTFNRIFKKQIGMTPREFNQKNQLSDAERHR